MENNTPEQPLLGDFPDAVVDAVMASGDAHNEIKTQFLTDKVIKTGFQKLILKILAEAV